MQNIFINHIGYDCADTKNAVYRRRGNETPLSFEVIDDLAGKVVFKGVPAEMGEVDNWKKGFFYTLTFDDVREKGTYYISVTDDEGKVVNSYPFRIAPNLLETDTISAVGYFFQSMRCTGESKYADSKLKPLYAEYGRLDGEYDLHGGWHDATGDPGVHLSHLNDSIYFNPQQASFSACAFFRMHDLLNESEYPYYTQLKRRLLEEGMYGAEFLMRMRKPECGFFISKSHSNALEPTMETRHVGAFLSRVVERYGGWARLNLERDLRKEDYMASMRAGGGYAVAALAAAARYNYPSEFTNKEYLKAAKEGMQYLMDNNEQLVGDGKWNLVDEYCALDAFNELYKTTQEYGYLVRARKMAERVLSHFVEVDATMGYLSVNETDRPFFHAADAGMPVVNLLNYREIEPEKELKDNVLAVCEKVMRYQIKITTEVPNPFGYARQYTQNLKGERKTLFFYPHDVETYGWWQGESARLGSLATAARALSYLTEDTKLKGDLEKFADDQINWILGLNPYDSCMLQGRGRNNITYFYIGNRYDFFQVPGGISNGITGGKDDEHGIEFVFDPTEDINDNWRWAEEWLPHCTWYMYALCMKKR